jgi:outer membrane protein
MTSVCTVALATVGTTATVAIMAVVRVTERVCLLVDDSTSPKRRHIGGVVCLALPVLFAIQPATAESWLDFLRNYDLNDYALGVTYSTSQRPFAGTTNSNIVYPYLTSFEHSAFTDDWFLVEGGNIGFRYVTESDWVFGAIARVQTLGFNGAGSDELNGMDERRWSIEAGPFVGWRRWPVHLELRSYWELLDRHSGTTSELEISLPRHFGRGYFVPSVQLSYLSGDYSRYYYGVADFEARPDRPAYRPGSAVNIWAGFTLGYELTPKWLLSTTVGIEFLDSVVTDSPIVDRDKLWSASIGLAYNSDMFRPANKNSGDEPRFEFRASALRSSIDTVIIRAASNGEPGDEIDVEDVLGATDQQSLFHFDSFFRLAYFHRLELGYFDLLRRSSMTLQQDIQFGDKTFFAGSEIEMDATTSVLRFAYSYSLMRDKQKEVGVTAGLSYMRFETVVLENTTQLAERIRAKSLVPTIGVFASVAVGDNWRLSADVNAFALEFDHYEGYTAYLNANFDRQFGDNVKAGIGYSFYGARLESKIPDFLGTFRIRHHGPKLSLVLAF